MLRIDATQDSGKPATILVVDDEEINRLQLKTLLEQWGYAVLLAESGEEALRRLEDAPVDLILLDVMLPNIDGYETCRRIREEQGNLVLPVIFVTSLEDRRSRVRGKEVGGDDFLTKPVDDVELAVRVRNLLKLKAYHDLQEKRQERLEAEMELIQEQLFRVDRLATLGTLAAGVGHEMSNAVGVLKATTRFVRRACEQGRAPTPRDFDNLERVSRHLTTHAHQLLDMGRPGSDDKEPFDLREAIESTLSVLHQVGKTKYHRIQAFMPDEPVQLRMNRTQIEQVIMNLVGNAADAVAMSVSGRGAIRVGLDLEKRQDWVTCWVRDNGPGIQAEHMAKIFEPYFTTKPRGQGTGLGLTVVSHIVSSYGGHLTTHNAPEGGAIFEFDLPLSPGDAL